jgi:hypothetical protein
MVEIEKALQSEAPKSPRHKSGRMPADGINVSRTSRKRAPSISNTGQ